MRFSEGTTNGRFAEINNQNIFNDHEDVIDFPRENFSWVYRSRLIMLMILP